MTSEYHHHAGASFLAKNDMIVSWIRKEKKHFEPITGDFIKADLPDREGIFIDVGAATGWYALPVALTGREVLAIEANERVRNRFLQNALLNGLIVDEAPNGTNRLRLVAAAASSQIGVATFMHNPKLELTSGGSLEPGWTPNRASEEVPTVTLDSLVPEGVKVAMIKIDVERHELPVLQGAERIIRESKPLLILEANDEVHEAVLTVWLSAHGYKWRHADERNLLCC